MNTMQHKPQWQTLRRLREFGLMLMITLSTLGAHAQCINASAYGSATASTVVGTAVTISTCSFYGEYSTVFSIQAASSYTSNLRLNSSVTSAFAGFITITEGSPSGTVVGFGPSPLTWTSTSAGTYYCHWNSSSACGTDASCHATQVIYNGPATGCSGTPTAGTTTANGVSGTTGGCPSQAMALAVTGSTVATGLTYQWEYSATGIAGSYTAIPGATASTYGITSFTAGNVGYYQRIIACGANAATSTPVSVNLNTFVNCYCIPTTTYGCTAGDHITNVTFASFGSPINNTTGACLSASYSNYTGTVPAAQVSQGDMVTVSVSVNNGGTEYASGWIDYDQSGTFDAGEFIALTDADGVAPWVYTGTANIPFTAVAGTTGMRFRSSYAAAVTAGSACSVYNYGETEDYLVTIALSAACSGTPNPGDAKANGVPISYAACPGSNVVLSLTNQTIGTGVTYQWSNNGGPIAGATNATYTISGFSAADDYTCLVTCTSPGGGSAYSNVVSLTVNSFLNCYCTANSQFGTSGLFYGVISNVTFNALNNSSSAPASSPYYTNYAPTGTSVDQGTPYNLSVTLPQYGQAAVWFDWNQNGIFENTPSEFIFMGNNTANVSTTFTQSIFVPATATPGITRMRVRSEAYFYTNLTGTQACGNTNYGETEDYELTVIVPAACSGTPAPGNTTATAGSVCPGTNVTFGLSNVNNGTGISYQWYSNAGGLIAGATNSFYTGAVYTADDYYCLLTCTNSGLTATSNPVSIAINTFMDCYCASGATATFDEEIYSVTLNGASTNPLYAGVAGCSTAAPGPGSLLGRYSNFKTLGNLTTLTQGTTVPFIVEENECDGPAYYPFGTAIWIDLNQNGSYADPGEQLFVEAATATGPRNVTGNISIPYTANLGVTTMRVIVAEGYSGAGLTPCLSYGYGETEDFQVEIIANVACTGVVPPGNTIASATTVCPNTSVNLSLQNPTPGSGVTYQWYSNLGGMIGGATNATYSPVITAQDDFWCEVSCNGTGTTASNAVTITLNGFLNCYCATGLGGICGTQSINSVAISPSTLNNITGGCTTPYSVFPATGSTTAILTQGNAYNMTVGTGNNGNPAQIAFWIDYDHSGTFDATEYTLVAASSPSGGSSTISFTVPVTSLTGQTGMRVRTDWASSAAFTPGIACSFLTYGETEQYIIDIVANTPCAGTPGPGNTLASVSAVCPGGTVTLSLQNAATLGSGVTYQWYSNTGGAIAGATGSFYTATINATDDYWCDVTCTNSSQSALSNPVTVSLSPFFGCYCASGATTTFDEEIYSVTVNGSSTPAAYAGVSGCTTPAPGPGSILNRYSNFTTLGTFATMTEGAPVSFTIEENECDGPTYYPFGTAIYIDYNQNGSYSDAGELVFVETTTATGPRNVTGTFNVPYGVMTGQTGMRVIVAEGIAGASFNPCLSYGYGETEDFIVDILPTVACTGTPIPGSTIASAGSVCPNGMVVLSLQNQAILGAGNTYQWYNSTGAISGATNSTYNAVITAATSFYCDVTCTASGLTGSSTPVSVGLNNFFSCYCTANLHSAGSPCIDQIDFNTLSNNSAAAGCALPAYTAYPATTATTTVFQGMAYTLTRVASGTGAWTGVWIDYDHSGTFDVSEYTNLSTTATGALSNSVSITIPFTALTGQTGMRIRQRVVDMTAADACTPNFGSGESEDYVIDIQVPFACNGIPTPGNTVASAASVCPNQTVTLSLSGQATLGSGNNYQWFNNAGAIAGATNPTYVATMTAADAFYCDVTCTNSSQTASSVAVSVGLNSFFGCYCASGATTAFDEEIYSVTVNGASTPAAYAGANGCSTAAPGAGSLLGRYSNFTSLGTFTTMQEGSTISFTIEEDECDGATYYAFGTAIWIDFNQNGSFADAGEQVFVEPLTATGPRNVTGTFTIPVGVTLGQTGMRITAAEGYSGATLTPCLSYGFGETEDYLVELTAAVPCSGTPAPGNTIASATAVCSGTTVNFSLQNATLGSGVTYQWFNNGGAIAGATNATYSEVMTAADAFYCEVTCSGQTGTSVATAITINTPQSCYCPAGATTIGCTTGDEYISNVTLNTINNASTCPPSGQYSDFTTISTNLVQGATYTASVLIPNWFTGDQASVWIDFNQDGILDDLTEQFPLTTGGGNGLTPLEGPVTIPATALTGSTRMRVRANYVGAMSSCGITQYGEVEDYTVVIDPVVSSTTLNLTAFVQAYWDGTSAMSPALFNQGQPNPNTDCDSITVELRTPSSPATVAYSTTAVLLTNGTATCAYPSGVAAGYYYIVVRGRNIIDTWSADSIAVTGATFAYDFSTAASQAYGSNQVELTTASIPNGIFAFYSGDMVKDAGEATDLLDLNQLEFEINNFSFGYFAEDLNGDGNVDILDTPSLEGNISSFIYSIHP